MPVITLTPTACTESAGWVVLFYYLSTNSAYYPRKINFTYPVNETLAGAGINITSVMIHGYARNSASAVKRLRWGFKPTATSGQSTWCALDGATVLASTFQAIGAASGSGSYIYNKFTQSYAGNSVIARHIKAMFDGGSPVYLGVIEPDLSRSISVNTELTYWTIDVEYELLGNIPTTDVSTAALGEAPVTTTITKVIEGSTTILRYLIGDTILASVDLGTGTTHVYTPPASLGETFPDALTCEMAIAADTYLDGVSYGTVATSVTLTLPADASPGASVSLSRIWSPDTAPSAQIDAYVQSQSGVTFAITGTGRYGATMAAYALTIEGRTYSDAVATHPLFAGSGSIPYTCSVTDSRGLTTTISGVIPVLPWTPPKIQSYTITRATVEGEEAIDGTYAKMNAALSVSSLMVDGIEKNQLSFLIRYREIAEEGEPEHEWISSDTVSGSSISGTFSGLLIKDGEYAGGGGVDVSGNDLPFNDMLGYEFQLVVSDMYGSSTAKDTMPTKVQHWDIDEASGNMGFGGDAPDASEEVGYRFHKGIDAASGIIVAGQRFGWHPGASIFLGINCRYPGHITGSSKGLYFSVYVGMPIFASGVTVSGTIVARGVKGYVDNMNYSTGITIPSSTYAASATIESAQTGVISVTVSKSAAFANVTNNTPITVHPASTGLKLTFT